MSLARASEMADRVDGPNWRPQERGVLCFIVKEGRILLIEKKRGLGAGKVNGPGGRIEKGETAEQAAVRETQEYRGRRFLFRDGPKVRPRRRWYRKKRVWFRWKK